MPKYQVIVGNVGKVYDGPEKATADGVFAEYVEISKSNVGRAGGEQVTLFTGDEITSEHEGSQPQE